MKTPILFITDGDKDDLYCLNLLMVQRHLDTMDIVGILCEDGFLTFPQNISMVSFWLYTVLGIQGNVPLVRGIPRDAYLVQQRQFPSQFITSYIEQMSSTFDYVPCPPNPIPSYTELDPFIEKLLHRLTDHSLFILTTSPVNSFTYIFRRYPAFQKKIARVTSMMGNFQVPGNVVPADPSSPEIVPNAEYNAWLNPNAWTVLASQSCIRWKVVPLDCTNYVPLDIQTIQQIQVTALPYIRQCKDAFLLRAYQKGIQLLYMTLQTINTKLYMWDQVACILFFGLSCKQKHQCIRLWMSWTGTLQSDRPYRKVWLYNYVDKPRFIENLVLCQFQPIRIYKIEQDNSYTLGDTRKHDNNEPCEQYL